MERPFNCDAVVQQECARLLFRYGIQQIVETGTYKGVTTEFLASFGLPIHTVEVVPETYESTKDRLAGKKNITCHLGNSAEVLAALLPGLPKVPTLFYADAHWQTYWPLRDELKVITKEFPGALAVIIIDDFQVPGRNYQFDSYLEQACNVEYLQDVLPTQGTHYYNDRSLRHHIPVGKLYCVPDAGDGLFATVNGVRYSNI